MKLTKFYAVAATAALALVGSFGMAGTALADGEIQDPPAAVVANPALVDATKKANLHITKYLGYPTGGVNNGTQQNIQGLPTLTGVNFDVYQVLVAEADGKTTPVDLTTNEGWELASKLKGATVADVNQEFTAGGQKFKLDAKKTVTTDENGLATLQNANLGVYYVVENLKDSEKITSEGKEVDKAGLSGAASFFVTLPMTNPDNETAWMYDVYVYPKNQNSGIEKEVLDAVKDTPNQDGYKVGENITFRIKSDITAVDANVDGKVDGADIEYYAIWDDLQKELEFQANPAPVLKIVKKDGKTEVPLVADTDYKQAVEGQKVSWSMTDAGLNKLAAADGGTVVTEFVVKVKSMPGNGVVKNTAKFYPNGNSLSKPTKPGETPPPPDEGVPSNETVTYYGKIVIEKYDPQNKQANVAGAVFHLYRDLNDNGKCEADEVAPDKSIMEATVAKNAETGKYEATFSGLHVSTYWNNTDKEGNKTAGHILAPSKYCVVETKAPDGYNLDAQPRPVEIDHATGTAQAAPFTTLKVANEESNLGNKLPLTGAAGVVIISLLGAALIGGGAVFYVRSPRRPKNA